LYREEFFSSLYFFLNFSKSRGEKVIEKKIKSLKDYTLKTFFGEHYLSVGEVKRIRFKNYQTFEAQVILGNLVEAEKDESEAKNLSVMLPELDLPSFPVEENLVNLPELKSEERVEETTSLSDEVAD